MQHTARIRTFWYNVSSSLWFVPAMMALGAVVLALALTFADRALDLHDPEDEGWWLIQSSAGSARQILTTIASTSATVLGVVFSITIIALQLASTQYSPRVLREFMRDRGSQVVMGTFIGTFTYALLMARTVRETDEGLYFVPIIGLSVGILLALASVGALIYFINHIAESIQAANLIATLARATVPLVDSAFPGPCGHPLERPPALDPFSSSPVHAPQSGYLQVIEADQLLELAIDCDIVIEMRRTVGEFIAEGAELVRVYPDGRVTEALTSDIRGLVSIGRRRTLQQDAAFGVQQLADIAVKAMSPSINDPTTALVCLDHFSAILRRMAERHDPLPHRADRTGTLRLVVRGVSFAGMTWIMLTPLRVYASADPNVVLRVYQMLQDVGALVASEERREVLWEHARMLAEAAGRDLHGEMERDRVNESIRELGRILRRDPVAILLAPPQRAGRGQARAG